MIGRVLAMLFIGLVTLEGVGAPGSQQMQIFDFSAGSRAWKSIDDVVMGGVSRSEMVIDGGVAVFRGDVSFANNGGFASVRSSPRPIDCAAFDGVQLRVRGDGSRYGFRIRTDAAFDGISYQAQITPPVSRWVDLRIPFNDFEAVYRGRRVPEHPPLDPARMTTFGLIISGQEGPFQLDIIRISAYRTTGSENDSL